jgi:hypothetical protein
MRTSKEIARDIVKEKIKKGEIMATNEQVKELIKLTLECYKLAVAIEAKLEVMSQAKEDIEAEGEK